MRLRILVRGSGDIGSAVAHHLFVSGAAVVIHEESAPTAARRLMAFTDAVFNGTAHLEGVEAKRIDDLADIDGALARRSCIPLVTAPFAAVLETYRPAMLVDARMRKRVHPETQRALAPLVIGLGPNFVAGENVDVAVETSWEDLGRVIRDGATLPLGGEPRDLGGHGRDRYVYAPVAGVFRARRAIGQRVQAGEVVAYIDETPLAAPLGGTLRGLTRDGVPVAVRTKVIEVDPRGEAVSWSGIGERPRRIAEGVLALVRAGRSLQPNGE